MTNSCTILNFSYNDQNLDFSIGLCTLSDEEVFICGNCSSNFRELIDNNYNWEGDNHFYSNNFRNKMEGLSEYLRIAEKLNEYDMELDANNLALRKFIRM